MRRGIGLPLLRLMHLISPNLPTGAFTYSQGIEWAVEQGWIADSGDLTGWLENQLATTIMYLDLPVLRRLYQAVLSDEPQAFAHWSEYLLASRETAELRLEEAQRGRALAELVVALGLTRSREWKNTLATSQAAGFAFAAVRWDIGAEEAALGYAWSWLENMVLAAVKIIPLGQTQGQQVLQGLGERISDAAKVGMRLPDDKIGASNTALAIASSRHETQYTRLFRS